MNEKISPLESALASDISPPLWDDPPPVLADDLGRDPRGRTRYRAPNSLYGAIQKN